MTPKTRRQLQILDGMLILGLALVLVFSPADFKGSLEFRWGYIEGALAGLASAVSIHLTLGG